VGNKFLFLLVAVLLLTPSLAVAQTVTSPPPANVGLGFGPTSIQPVTVGVPVYVRGDELWVQSYEVSSELYLTLSAPSTTGGSNVLLDPGGLIRLRTFEPSDPLGVWILKVQSFGTGQTNYLNITLAGSPPLLTPTFIGANVSRSTLQLGYSISATAAYDVQECTVGTSTGSSTSFQLPSALGGMLQVNLDGYTAIITSPGALSTFTGWLELYTSRAYAKGSSLISEETMAAQTAGVFIQNGTSESVVQLNTQMAFREGRYDLRVFVRGPSGLGAYESPYLMTNSRGWVALSSCTQLSSVESGTFVMSSSLDDSNSTWPRLLYSMYTAGGVDSYAVSAVPVAEGRIDLGNAAGAENLLSVGLSVSGAGNGTWDAYDGGIYVVGTHFPLPLTVSVNFEGVTSESFDVTIQRPFTFVRLGVAAGSLTVHAAAQGSSVANATVEISAGQAQPASFRTDSQGNVTVTLPPGAYSVTAIYSGRVSTGEAQVSAGGNALVTLDLGAQSLPLGLYALITILVAAGVLDVVVWRAYLERRSS
jgi:Carboxypeptidase regulatory-like domain